ncbi:MAG: phosphotransferase [Myxococcales bacterium]|nr:phosphotransferase [Myxococcales bacterium]
MNGDDVRRLASRGAWKGEPLCATVVETHVSWVLLATSFAFKIKKPVRFSFVDFSTLERRKHFCQREVALNRRLTDIYLGVVPIVGGEGGLTLGGEDASAVDYAVCMRRMDPELEMSRLLAQDRVTPRQIEELARVLARFHASAEIVRAPFDEAEMRERLNDLRTVCGRVHQRLGPRYAAICDAAMDYSDRYIEQSRSLLAARVAKGFRRDVHGDVHTGNVFLSTPPVIFDCVEFDDALRRIDLLDEVAFLCMDLEAKHHDDLSKRFLDAYTKRMGFELSADERSLLSYYEIYRASVRAKVTALKECTAHDWGEVARFLDYVDTRLAAVGCVPIT